MASATYRCTAERHQTLDSRTNALRARLGRADTLVTGKGGMRPLPAAAAPAPGTTGPAIVALPIFRLALASHCARLW